MAKGWCGRVRLAALILAFVNAIAAIPPAHAQAASGYAESPSDALARNMKILGGDSTDFNALIGAGRAALAMGDTQAAVGFFGRADEVWPSSPLSQAGMGAAMAQDGDATAALQCFAKAVQRGATQSMIGSDRGLAYDLLGQHAQAQADYRAALLGRDGDEARRRLALSLAISGNKAEALSILAPLMARGDAAAARTRAFVLALTGDISGARTAIDAAMPGSSSKMGYFFQKLASLRSDQKAAAVNLGIFPDSAVRVASASGSSAMASSQEDRMKSIEDWLSNPPSSTGSPIQPQPVPQQVASVSLPTRIIAPSPAARGSSSVGIYSTQKLWLQLASGASAAALPGEFDRLKRKSRDLFEGISGYVFDDGTRARLLIGPFKNSDDASVFADDLASVHIDAFTWTSQPGQTIRKLPSE